MIASSPKKEDDPNEQTAAFLQESPRVNNQNTGAFKAVDREVDHYNELYPEESKEVED